MVKCKMMTIYVLTLLLCVILLQSCTTFKNPTGEWESEELGISLNFNRHGGMNDTVSARGYIYMNNEYKPIVCSMNALGGAIICLREDFEKSETEPRASPMANPKFLYDGYFRYKGQKMLIFVVERKYDSDEIVELEKKETYAFIQTST